MREGEPWILEFFNVHIQKNKWEPMKSWRIDHHPDGFVVAKTKKEATRFSLEDALTAGKMIEEQWGGRIQVRLKNIWTKEIIPLAAI